MRRRWLGHALLALALSLPLAACDSDSGVGADTGRVTVLLTDAPDDVETAVVTISKVYLQGDGGETVLSDREVTTDLLTLANDVATLVEDVVIPAGTYSQLRLVITGGYIEVENEDGSTSVYATAGYEHVPEGVAVDGELHCPSCGQSGLKVNLPGGGVRIQGEEKVLLLDFDVAQSFGRQAGNSGRWVMNPVIKATDFSFSGSIAVTLHLAEGVSLPVIDDVQLTLGAFGLRMVNAGESEETLAFTDADGDLVFEAEFKYLIPGEYTVEFVAPEGLTVVTDPVLPLTVEVGSGARVTKEIQITSVAGS